MENAFMPGLSSITWTSMKIPEFCENVTETLNYIEMFVKEVSTVTIYCRADMISFSMKGKRHEGS